MQIRYAFLPVMLVLILILSGCGVSTEGDETTLSAETAAPVTEAVPTVTQLTEGGKAVYTIVRSDLGGKDLVSLAQQTMNRLNDDLGVRFTLATDWIKRDTLPDSTIPELLVGTTNRPETAAVAERLGWGGYAVAVEGQKVVIYGNTYDAQQKAVDAFFGALSKNTAGEIVLDLPAGGIMETGEKAFFSAGNAADYVIVTDAEYKESALALQTAIRKKYGYELPLRSPSDAETAREIVVGICGRAAAEAALKDTSSPIGYQIKLDGEKIVLAGKSKFGTKQAVNYFLETYVENDFAALLQIPSDMDFGFVGLVGAEYVELTEGADIRIMSFNILTELWDLKLPIEGRDEIVAETLLTYMPDVIGWQEVSDRWYKLLVPMVEDQYTFVNQKTAEGKTNYSGMAYNKDKVKMIDSGCELFSQGNSGNMRLMNWAVFETIAGGERFALINTHLDINNKTGEKNAYRLVQAKEMGEKVKVLQKAYNCPVIITGDYNCNRNTEEYKLFVTTAGVKDAQWDSAKAVNNDYKTYHDVGSKAGAGDTSIDHITYTEGAESLFYINHNTDPIIQASDHNPIMADFKLN